MTKIIKIATALTVTAAVSTFLLSKYTVAPAQAGHELLGRNVSAGETLYQENCAVCHGANLEGQKNWQSPDENGVMPAPPHDQSGHTWHHDNQLLFDYTKLGGQVLVESRGINDFKSGMPGFGGALSDEEIWDILGYIYSTWPERVQEIQSGRNPPHG
jgi:mono/diheme cytochrome c family protein